ncbi:MAG: Hsp70 family protein [Defluviitaleaceae bacterium]|nr:Hsp70 family protein [Defluviitaleaceae bacterium]
MKIGLDFGMTNSTISFYDDEKRLVNFRLHAADNDYIPTAISYNKKKLEDISIGLSARGNITDSDYDTYEKFKLKLGTGFSAPLPGKTKTPIDVTHDFLLSFLREFKQDQNKDIDGIVMTVPATWVRESSNQTARENIEKIFSKMGYESEIQLESEPVAAAVFFCHSYKNNKKNKHGTDYNGFITVIDYGGGTLDVTICRSDGKTINVLERYGYGEDNETKGRAGVAFDEAVTDKLIADNNLDIKPGSPGYIRLREQFERKKIIERKVTDYLKLYYDDPSILEGEHVFSLEYHDRQIKVTCEDLVHCFEKVNAPALNDSLKSAKEFFDAHKIDDTSQDNFKVLLVGGFSNFYPVEKVVREFFRSLPGIEDKRFDQPFPTMNRTFAISRGAALIAQNIYEPVHTCPYNIGYVTYSIKGDSFAAEDKPVIQKGTKLADVKAAVFSDVVLKVAHTAASLRVYFDDGRPGGIGRRQLKVEESISELFPNIGTDNEYRVGFSLNRNTVPTLHIVDKSGNEVKTSLFKLYEKLSIVEK